MNFKRFSLFVGVAVAVFGLAGIGQVWAAACVSNTASGNWNTAGSWTSCGGTTPQSADTVKIANGHTITLDTTATVAGVTIDSGGTLTEDGNSRMLTVGASGWNNAGTFTANTSKIRFLTNTSSTLVGNTTFNQIEFSWSSGGAPTYVIGSSATTTTFTVNATTTISGANNITLNTGNTDTTVSNLNAKGDIYISSTGTGAAGTATITINGSDDQLLTGNGTVGQGRLPKVVINRSSENSGKKLYLSSTITVNGGWTYTAGTVDVTSYSNRVAFTGNQTILGSMTFADVDFAFISGSLTATIGSASVATTMTVNGTLRITGTNGVTINTGNTDTSLSNIDAKGDVTITNTGTNGGGTGVITFNGTGNQTLSAGSTVNQGRLPKVVINRASESGGSKLTLSGMISLAGATWTYTTGTVDATTSSSTLYVAANTTVDGQGTSATMSFDNVIVGGGTLTLGGNLDVDRELTIASTRTLTTSNNNVNVGGNWTNAGTYTSGSNTTTFDGSGNSVIITGGTGTTQDFNNFTVAKTGSGVAQLSTNGLDVDGTLTVSSGTLDINGQAVSTVTTCSVTGTLKLTGDETISCTPTLNSGSTVEYSATSGARAIKNWTYHSLKINGSGGTFSDTGTRSLGGDFTLAAGTFSAPTTLNVAGNWTKSGGTFTHNSATVVLNGTNQTISGSTGFHNLTKQDSNNNSTDLTLTFDEAGTQTVGGLLTLKGTDSDDRVNLVSSNPPAQWSLVANGTFDIDWVDVTDSDASGGSQVTLATPANNVNGGNNLNWGFITNQTPTVSTLGPAGYVDGSWTTDSTPTLTFSTADGDGDTVRYNVQIDDSSDFASLVVDAYSSFAAAGSSQYTPSTLSDGSYYWRVRVSDGTATSSFSTANSGSVAFRVDTAGPNISSISAGTPGGSSATITWTTNENSTSQVEYGLTASYGSITSLDSNVVTSHSVGLSGLTPATTYHYRVASVDAAGNSASSTDQTFTTADTSEPSVSMTAPTAGSYVLGTITLSADASDNVGVSGVQFKRGANTLVGSEDTSSPYSIQLDTTALTDGSYSFFAVARDGDGNYATSSTVAVTVDNTAPTAGSFSFTSVTATAITASSTGASDATAGLAVLPYQYRNVTTNTYSSLTAGAVTSSSLTPNTSYSFTVGVVDQSGNWATTTSAATTTLAATPVSLTFDEDEVDQIVVSWGANSNPAGTEYYVENTTAATNSGWITTTTWTSTSLATSTSYSFSVKARNSAGVETSTLTGSATTDDGAADPEPEPEEEDSGRSGGGGRYLRRVVEAPVQAITTLYEIIPDSFWASTPVGPALPPVSPADLPVTPPPSLTGEWQLAPDLAIKDLLLNPLPGSVGDLVTKFPTLEQLFANLGVSQVADLKKLSGTAINLPSLAELGEEVPTDTVFARGAGGTIDKKVSVLVSEQGTFQKNLNILAGKSVEFVIKPSQEVNAIKGYLLLAERPRPNIISRLASQLVAAVGLSAKDSTSSATTEIENRLVVEEFDYTDPDGDGLYTGTLRTPIVAGKYELVTTLAYKSVKLGTKELRLTTVIDPEGYIFERIDGKEARVPGATVTLWWRNPATASFEVWPADKYQQDNPQVTAERGTYSFLVPEGSYYLVVQAKDYRPFQGDVFEVRSGNSVHANIELTAEFNLARVFDWKLILLIVTLVLLGYNFYRDRKH